MHYPEGYVMRDPTAETRRRGGRAAARRSRSMAAPSPCSTSASCEATSFSMPKYCVP